jgi:hypothetical protein
VAAADAADDASRMSSHLYDPRARDARYAGNYAQYLVDLHDARGTFNFCGGMMFQLCLSDALRARLAAAAAGGDGAPAPVAVHAAEYKRMQMLPKYGQSADADSAVIFHGREVRQVPTAAGGMAFVLHLSDTDENDPEGWSPQEREDYNGWGHDSNRPWRKLSQWEAEGVAGFREKFGDAAYGLHHRFFLHLDKQNKFWLSAEDGCEGFASSAGGRFS